MQYRFEGKFKKVAFATLSRFFAFQLMQLINMASERFVYCHVISSRKTRIRITAV